MIVNPKTAAYPWHTITVDEGRLVAVLHAEEIDHVQYGLGAKAASLSDAPGVDRRIDCSGFVRWIVFQASGGKVVFPDGSVTQHELCRTLFKPCEKADIGDRDGVLRIAFLSPESTSEGIGHVMLVLNGVTIESHGGHGPDSRAWGSQGWMSLCEGYVLALAGSE